MKQSERNEIRIKLIGIKLRLRGRNRVRLDADEGSWITTENGHHVHLNSEGEPDKGNPHVISAMKGGGGGTSNRVGNGSVGKAKAEGRLKHYSQLVGYKATAEQHAKAGEALSRYRKESGFTNPADYSKKYVGKSADEYTDIKKASLPERADKDVRKVYNRFCDTEKKVTSDLNEAMSGLDGIEMRENDLLFRMKEGDSFQRKVDGMVKSGKYGSAAQAALAVDDAIRYTTISTPETLVDNFNKTVATLESKGYEMVHCENLFTNTGTAFNCISTNFKAPDGSLFELWFHTGETKEAQDQGGHAYYEALRWSGTTNEERENLGSVLYERYYNCKIPDKIETVKDKFEDGKGSHY